MSSNQSIDQQKRKLVQQSLKNLATKTKNQQIKKVITTCLQNFSNDSRMDTLLQNFKNYPLIKSALRVLSYQYNSWKISYRQIIKKYPEYQNSNKDFDIQNFLLSIQPNVKFDMEQFERLLQLNINSKYTAPSLTYLLQINKLRIKNNWPKQFVTQWRQRKQKTLIQLQKNRKNPNTHQNPHQNQPVASTTQQSTSNFKQQANPLSYPPSTNIQKPSTEKLQSNHPPRQPNISNIVPPMSNPSTYQSEASKPPKSEPKIQAKLQHVKSQPNISPTNVPPKPKLKPGPKPKNLQNRQDLSQDDYSADNIKKTSASKQKTYKKEKLQQNKSSIQRSDDLVTQKKEQKKFLKSRTQALIAYLQKRKDLYLKPQNIQQVGEYLNDKLQIFMKGILQKTIKVAKLRNNGYAKSSGGNQFKYFSKDNKDIEWNGQIKVPKNQQIYKIIYPNKLQLYSQMRIQEEYEEDKIEKELSKKKDVQKKKDNRILQYLLAPRQAQTQSWVEKTQASTQRLVISNNHVQYVLQDHETLRNSIAMFMSLV